MPRPIALFDIDNTIYHGFSYFELLKKQVEEDLINKQVLDDAQATMQKYKSNLQDYETTIVKLLDMYALGLRGKRYATVLESTEQFYRNSNNFFAYAKPAIEMLKQSHDIALVTGEPQFVAKAVGERFGIDVYCASEYEVIGGKFTSRITSYLASRHEKHDAIQYLLRDHDSEASCAFGDSEGDIEMLRAVGHPICLNPTDGLRATAVKEGWAMPTVKELPSLITSLSVVVA